MEPSRQQASLALIQRLLNCPSGEEPAILKAHADLLDSGFVAMCQKSAQLQEKQNQHENARSLSASETLLPPQKRQWILIAPVLQGNRHALRFGVSRIPQGCGLQSLAQAAG
jgi:hypothetical protein